jgi:hypothetical protein
MERTEIKMLAEMLKTQKVGDSSTLLFDIVNMISNRCENALVCNEEYTVLQEQLAKAYENKDLYLYSEISNKMEIIACYTSYIKAVYDINSL